MVGGDVLFGRVESGVLGRGWSGRFLVVVGWLVGRSFSGAGGGW